MSNSAKEPSTQHTKSVSISAPDDEASYMNARVLSTSSAGDIVTPGLSEIPTTPDLFSRTGSVSEFSDFQDEEYTENLPPPERITIFDFLENLALPQRLERLQASLSQQSEKVRRQQQRIRDSSKFAKDKVVDEWRRRIPQPEERLRKYRRRMGDTVDRFSKRWAEAANVTTREKTSFIAGVLNIFISGYLLGAFPQFFHYWYTVQLCYYFPVRYYTYHKKGMHYFLADLCYYVNLLLFVSIWIAPQSKRLFISTFCLAFGNNAVAIAMWRNSLVFHSLDKITSLFIHIMPCVTIHCLVHIIPEPLQASRFPAIHTIKYSPPTSPEHYGLVSMMIWANVPYLIWQSCYHLFITVRRRAQIAEGRPTSFTWLRKSYANTWIGKFVLAQPEWLQEPTFMMIQYVYAMLTMLPAPIWFWFRWPSAIFLMVVFVWSIYNGATYYIDVFGNRFRKELDQLKKDIARLQQSPDIAGRPPLTPGSESGNKFQDLNLGDAAVTQVEPQQSQNAVSSGANANGGASNADRTASTSGYQSKDGNSADRTRERNLNA